MRHNQLTAFPDISCMLSLGELYLESNKIDEVPGEVFASADCELHLLNLASNDISSLPKEVRHLQKLTTLDITNNVFRVLPPHLAEISSLKWLRVDGNPLRSPPQSVIAKGSAAMLEYLASRLPLSSSCKTPTRMLKREVMAAMSSEHGGVALDLSDKGLTNDVGVEIPDCNITEVNLARNDFQSLPQTLKGLVKCREMNISNNRISSLPLFVQDYEYLQRFLCRYNNFLHFPLQLCSLNNLVEVDLSHNKIAELPEALRNLNLLQELNLSYNQLQSIDCLSCPKLHTLLVNDNQITTINGSSLRKLKNLTVFDISNNNLTSLPPELSLLPLKRLDVEGNCIRTIRRAILQKGTSSLLEYLGQRMPK